MQIFNCRRVSIPDPLVFQGQLYASIYRNLYMNKYMLFPLFSWKNLSLNPFFKKHSLPFNISYYDPTFDEKA